MPRFGHYPREAIPPAVPAGTACPGCGNLVTCTCGLAAQHDATCRFRRAAELSIEVACPHGFQACPRCDPCDCGYTGPIVGVR